MTGNLTRKLEVAANVAIIGVAVLICGVLVKTYLLGGAAPRAPLQASLVGARVSVPEVDWKKNGRTLVLVLQKGCRFCAESAPFYQRLARDAANLGPVRLIAVLPQQVEESHQYLRDLGVPIEDVRQMKIQELGVKGTPSLILVNGDGVITGSWFGRLPPDKEDEVLNRLKS
jgi:hypothetical protein